MSKDESPNKKSRTRGFAVAGVVLAVAAIVVLAATADDDGDIVATESETLATSPVSTASATIDAGEQMPDAMAELSDFASRFEAATKLEPAGASRRTEWPCTSSYDRSNDGVIDAEITYTYGGPASCSLPANLLLFGCPTLAVTKTSEGVISKKQFLSYDAKGQLLALRTEKGDKSIRVLFTYEGQALAGSDTDSSNDGEVDYQSAYETKDDNVMWYRHATDRTKPSSTMHLKEGRLVLADSPPVSKAYTWEGDRVVSEVASMGARAMATFTFGYACDGAEEQDSGTASIDLANVEPACLKSGQRALKKCLLTAKAIKDGTGREADPKLALALFEKTCERKSGLGCLGAALIAGGDNKALEYYEQACRYGMGTGCLMVGIAHDQDGLATKDLPKAVAFYTKACDMGDSAGCSNLGAMYAQGTGVAASGPAAIKFLGKACEQDDPRGCGMLGIVLAQGRIVEKNTDEARLKLGKACQLGFAPACEMEPEL